MNVDNSDKLTKDEYRDIISRFSHEIRNPISIISSELQLIEEKHPEVTYFEGWETIQEHIQYLCELLAEFATFHNAHGLTLSTTNLTEYFKTILAAVKPAMDYLGITYIRDIPDNLPVFPIDRIKLRQALLNLIRNAQDAVTDKQGIVRVSISVTDNSWIKISVTDTGNGISKEILPDLFTPFITSKPEGTGLGLAITKEIVEAHHGTLKVRHTSDTGTTFEIGLPLSNTFSRSTENTD